jgi:hypothetical protein
LSAVAPRTSSPSGSSRGIRGEERRRPGPKSKRD